VIAGTLAAVGIAFLLGSAWLWRRRSTLLESGRTHG
jgi:hypothetical protein